MTKRKKKKNQKIQNKEKSSFKRQTLQGVEKWKKHIKNNPQDYKDIDKFFNNKKKKFNPKDLAGKSVKYKSKEKRMADERYYKKKKMKRPGKVKRIRRKGKKERSYKI